MRRRESFTPPTTSRSLSEPPLPQQLGGDHPFAQQHLAMQYYAPYPFIGPHMGHPYWMAASVAHAGLPVPQPWSSAEFQRQTPQQWPQAPGLPPFPTPGSQAGPYGGHSPLPTPGRLPGPYPLQREQSQQQISRPGRNGTQANSTALAGQGRDGPGQQGRGGGGEAPPQAAQLRRHPSKRGGAPRSAQTHQRWPSDPTSNPLARVSHPGSQGKQSPPSLGNVSMTATTGTQATETEEEGHLEPSLGSSASLGEAAGSAGPQGEGSRGRRSSLQICNYYIRTGECKFGDACKYAHPTEMKPLFTSAGLPIRPGQKLCKFHEEYRWCGFGKCCKYNHRELTPRSDAGSNAAVDSENEARGAELEAQAAPPGESAPKDSPRDTEPPTPESAPPEPELKNALTKSLTLKDL